MKVRKLDQDDRTLLAMFGPCWLCGSAQNVLSVFDPDLVSHGSACTNPGCDAYDSRIELAEETK